MKRTLEQIVVEQCAPTLAGVKPASLFRYQPEPGSCAGKAVMELGKMMYQRGLNLRILKVCQKTGACMLYLYREDRVKRILDRPENEAFLREQGYWTDGGLEGILRELSRRLCLNQDYPHEIGVFLGYPLEDVVGFIENRGKCYACCGYWKVYGDPVGAQKQFDCFRRCTTCYMEQYRKGTELSRLVVA